MKIHLRRIFIGCCLSALGCLALFPSGACAEAKTLIYAEVNPLADTITGAMGKAFKEKTEQLSGGKLRIELQGGGALGSEEQILYDLTNGGEVTDIARISSFSLVRYGCEKSALLNLPYTFHNEEHFWNFAKSSLAEELLMEPQEHGIPLRGLCYGEEGFRHFFFTQKVADLKDMRSLRLRAPYDPIITSMMKDLGAVPTPVRFTTLHGALSTGIVSGAEQPIINYYSNAFYESAPYVLLDGHTLGIVEIVIRDGKWKELSPQEQEWLQKAAQYASDICREKVQEMEDATLKALETREVTVIEVKDKASWVQACQPTIRARARNHYELYQRIRDMK